MAPRGRVVFGRSSSGSSEGDSLEVTPSAAGAGSPEGDPSEDGVSDDCVSDDGISEDGSSAMGSLEGVSSESGSSVGGKLGASRVRGRQSWVSPPSLLPRRVRERPEEALS